MANGVTIEDDGRICMTLWKRLRVRRQIARGLGHVSKKRSGAPGSPYPIRPLPVVVRRLLAQAIMGMTR